MWIEQINKIEKAIGTLNKSQKIDKIKNSLSNIKDIKTPILKNIKDAKDRADLKNKLLAISIPYDGDIIESSVKYALSPIIDSVLEQYDSFTNNWIRNIQDFLTDKFSYIQNLVSDKLNIQDIRVRHFVDTVYSVWYSFEKQNGQYIILNPKTNKEVKITSTDWTTNIDILDTINNDKNLIDSLDEVLVERSFTGEWLNIQEMVEILRTIWINPENKKDMEKIKPNDLAQAYLNYYSKKLNYSPVPQLNKPNDIKNFLNNTRIKWKIPNEKVTYIKLVQKNAFWTDINDSTEHDTEVLRNMMSDFSKLTQVTSWELAVAKEAASNVWWMIKDWVPGLMKYMNWPEWLVLAAWLIFVLFFSDFKKKAWLWILWFTWLNVLTKAYNQDNNKWILQSLWNAIESWVWYEAKLPPILKWLEKQEWLKEDKAKVNTIAIISSKNFKEIMDNVKMSSSWNMVEIQDFSIFDGIDQKKLKKLWPAWNWKKKVNDLLTDFVDRSATKTWTKSLTLEEQKNALIQEYTKPKYSNPRLSTVIADVLLWNITTTTTPISSISSVSSTVRTAPNLSNIPNNIQTELDQINGNTVKNLISTKLNIYYKDTTNIANKSIVKTFISTIVNSNPPYKNALNNILNTL